MDFPVRKTRRSEQSCGVVVNHSGLWSRKQRFESVQDYFFFFVFSFNSSFIILSILLSLFFQLFFQFFFHYSFNSSLLFFQFFLFLLRRPVFPVLPFFRASQCSHRLMWKCEITRVKKWDHTSENVRSHEWKSEVTRVKKWSHTREKVKSHAWKSEIVRMRK